MFPGLLKIRLEPGVASSDRNVSYAGPAQTGRERVRMNEMFPYLQRIGSTMDCGPSADDRGRRGRYEV